MTNLFKQAHALTRATIQAGDDYQATFTLCLRAIIADAKQANSEPMANQFNSIFEAINYQAPTYSTAPSLPPKAVWNTSHPIVKACMAIKSLDFELLAPIAAFVMLFVVFFALLFGFHTVSANTADNRQHDRTMQTIDKIASHAPSSTDIMFNNIQSAIDASGVQGVTVVYE